jgi:DNA-binding GntR family transcriptional regulator
LSGQVIVGAGTRTEIVKQGETPLSENSTLTQKAYHHIHDQLASGQLAPGTRLSNRGVAKEIGISFTPVREALNRLVSEGLLEYHQGLGVFVPEINPQEIHDIYELREILESEAAVRICEMPVSEAVIGMAQNYDQMSDITKQMQDTTDKETFDRLATEFQVADSAFHMSLIYAAGNRRLFDVVQGLQVSLKAMMGSLQNTPVLMAHRFEAGSQDQIQRTLDEHGRIIEAIKQKDTEGVRTAIVEHIRRGCSMALARLHHSRMSYTKK